MSLNVIGAGWGRSGTATLKVALERLGVGRCYHMLHLWLMLWHDGHLLCFFIF